MKVFSLQNVNRSLISWHHLKQCQVMQCNIQWELSFLSRCPDLHLCRTGHTVFAQDALVIALSLKHTGKLKTKWPMAQTDRHIVIYKWLLSIASNFEIVTWKLIWFIFDSLATYFKSHGRLIVLLTTQLLGVCILLLSSRLIIYMFYCKADFIL